MSWDMRISMVVVLRLRRRDWTGGISETCFSTSKPCCEQRFTLGANLSTASTSNWNSRRMDASWWTSLPDEEEDNNVVEREERRGEERREV
jgi:hypothetical protein